MAHGSRSKVLVTGGAGFIGAHLVARLVEAGTDVVVVDNMKRGHKEKLQPFITQRRVTLIQDDIREYAPMLAAAMGCDVIYHLAAQSNVMGAADDPTYSITTNVVGTCNVLRAAADGRVPRVVFTSSREVYGEPRHLPVAEDYPMLPKNLYGASKVSGEAYCLAFAATRGLRIEVVRLANVYGPGDSGRVIPLWFEAAHSGRDLLVYGGEQIIDFLWVGTAVEALVQAADKGLPGPTNVGTGVGTSILDLAQKILAVTASRSRVVRMPSREIEVAKFIADPTRLRAFGLEPEADPLAHLGEISASYAPR